MAGGTVRDDKNDDRNEEAEMSKGTISCRPADGRITRLAGRKRLEGAAVGLAAYSLLTSRLTGSWRADRFGGVTRKGQSPSDPNGR
jgi:hypothetical protein